MTTADKMRAAEKLLSRLSERKKSIIEHVKQQTELYSQHLASKLLIEGIQPPSWLRDPSASGSKELNEEDLISKLLRQYPQSSAPWSVARYPGHNNLVITGDDEKYSDGFFLENSVSNKDLDQKNDLAAPGFSSEDHGECQLDTVHEQNASAASPEDQTDEGILNIYTVPDQSLVRIQRSKSRQKALELRSSGKAPAKSGLRHESTSDVGSSQIGFSLSITDELGQNNELPSSSRHLLGKSDFSSKRERAHRDSLEPDVQDSPSPGKKVIEHHSHAKVPERSGLRHESTSDIVSSQIRVSLSIIDQPGQNNELPSSSRHIPEKSDSSSKGERAHRDSFEPDVHESPDSHVGNIGPVIGSATPNASNDSSETELNCRSSGVQHETHNVLSELVGSTDIQILPEELLAKHELESSPVHCMEQGNCNDEASDKDQWVSSALESKSSRLSYGYNSAKDPEAKSNVCVIEKRGTNQIAIDEIKQYQISSWPEGEVYSEHDVSSLGNNSLGIPSATRLDGKNSSLERRVGHARIESWPQVKRRKIEHQQAHVFATSQSFPLTKPHTFQRDHDIIYPKTMDFNIDTDFEEHVDKGTEGGICSEVNLDMMEGIQSATLSQYEPPSSSRHLPRKSDISCKGERAQKDSFERDVQESLHINMMEGIQSSTLSQHELPSSSRHLRGKSDISSKGERDHRDSFEPDVQESPHTHVGNFGPVIGSAILNAFNDSSEAELNCRSSEVQHETHNVLSILISTTDNQNPPVELLVDHGLESSPLHCTEQGDCNHEASDKDQQVSSASERSKSSRLSYGQNSVKVPESKSYCCSVEKTGIVQIANDEIKQYPSQQYQMLSWPEDEVCSEHEVSSLGNNSLGKPSTIRYDGKNSSLERRLTNARIESWPQVKRRKVEHQQAHVFATSQSFRVRKPHTFQRDPDIIYPKTMESDIDTGVEEHVDKGTDDVICSEVNLSIMEGIQSATSSQHVEVGSCHIKKNEQLVATISSLAVKESRNSQGCFIEGTRTSPASCDYLVARMSGDKQCSQNLCNLENNADNLSSESLNLSCTLHKEIRLSPKWNDGIHLQDSVLSSSNEDPHLTDVDQSMPVFEGFFVNQQTDTDKLDFAADGFDLCELDLPRSTLERASILAEICRSASLDRPSSHFSSAFKFQETSNLCKSFSDDDHFDHMEFGNNYHLNADLGIHFQSRSSSSDDYKDALDGMPYSVSLAYSGERYGWDSRNQPPSPVGKLWNQLSSHTGSSGKCSISNPELTCFPIEEDPSSSEENKTMEGNGGDTLDETDSSLVNHCDKRQPLKDLTNMDTNPPMSASPEEKTMRADSMDFLSSKFSVTGTQKKTLLGPKYHCMKKSETSEKQTSCTCATDGRKHQLSSIGSNAIKRANRSVKDSSSKAIVSKTSLKGQDHKLSLRESRTNNIVSNVRSFIPLIQQKQAATAACTGKRDVKVKALEAAEAAKRLMEKKVNERNQRKEALKFERAEKNLKHMELENKRKEEERKKKNADIAKKRLREDDEKKEKEKEKKRMRLESKQRQREQEEKKRVERHEIENQRTKNGQLNSKKEFNNESKRQQNKETIRGEGMALQKTDTYLTLNEVVRNHEESGTSGLSCGGEEMHAVDKSPRNEDLIAQKNQGKSYDISPYQCSDEEDEEDDELPIKKFVPPWSSRSSIALYIPLQHEVDPDMVFPPDSFCSMDEVLLHRKLQKKQVVA